MKFRKSKLEKKRFWAIVGPIRYIVLKTADQGWEVQVWDDDVDNDLNPIQRVSGFRTKRGAFWAVRRVVQHGG